MAENAEIFQGIQLGVETTYGTAVAADKKLQALGLNPGIQTEDDEFMPKGSKYKTLRIPNKEWVGSSLDGQPTYNEIIYPLSGILASAVVTTTGVSVWTFTSLQSAPDAIKSFTCEVGYGSSARRSAGLVFSGLTLDWDRNGGLAMGGDVFGKAIEDAITMTASPTLLGLIPIVAGDVEIYMNDTFGAIGTTRLARAFKATLALTGKFGPLYVFSRANRTGHTSFVELAPELKLTIEMEADAQGMSLLSKYRGGTTQYFRVEAISQTNIAGGTPTTPHSMVLDFVGNAKPQPFGDDQGVHSIGWEVLGLWDATAAKAFSMVVTNGLAAL